jgi:hypothetical protein
MRPTARRRRVNLLQQQPEADDDELVVVIAAIATTSPRSTRTRSAAVLTQFELLPKSSRWYPVADAVGVRLAFFPTMGFDIAVAADLCLLVQRQIAAEYYFPMCIHKRMYTKLGRRDNQKKGYLRV